MLIREVELFDRIPSHIIDEIAGFAVEETHPLDHVLFRQGEDADYLYILEDGQVAVTAPGEKPVTFPISEPGAIFGWSALVEPRKYTATAELSMDSQVVKIDGERLLRVFENHPHEGLTVMRRLAGVVASRLIQTYQRLV